jgi:uncharacterized protein (DUF697 family)
MFDYLFYKLREKMNLNDREEKSEKVIETAVAWSMGAGLLPIPIADLVAVTAVQVDMIRQMTKIYELEFSEGNLKTWISTLSGSVLSKLGAEAIKLIPGVGQVIGGVTMAIFSGASTYAIGQVFLKHFEEGGTLKDFDTDKFKSFYEEQFEKGKDLAKGIQDDIEKRGRGFFKEYFGGKDEPEPQAESPKTEKAQEQKTNTSENNASDPFEKLKQLVDFKDKGLISEQEFQLLKAKIMQSL